MIPAARAALEHVAGGVTVLATTARGEEARCAREAINRGATVIAVLGGDGTLSQVACELVRTQSIVPLAIFGAGTGNDFAKSLRVPVRDFRAMAARVAAGNTRTIDAARIDDDVFVNIAGFGFDTEVLARTLQPGFLRGHAAYITTAVSQLFRYRGFNASVNVAGTSIKQRWLTLIFANGAWFGAGFHIAPGAMLDDGLLHAVLINDTSAMRRASVFARATRGKHLGQPEVRTIAANSFAAHFDTPPLYQADGELRQARAATVTIESVPAAFRVIA